MTLIVFILLIACFALPRLAFCPLGVSFPPLATHNVRRFTRRKDRQPHARQEMPRTLAAAELPTPGEDKRCLCERLLWKRRLFEGHRRRGSNFSLLFGGRSHLVGGGVLPRTDIHGDLRSVCVELGGPRRLELVSVVCSTFADLSTCRYAPATMCSCVWWDPEPR